MVNTLREIAATLRALAVADFRQVAATEHVQQDPRAQLKNKHVAVCFKIVLYPVIIHKLYD